MAVYFHYVTYAFQNESRMAGLAKWLSVRLRTKWFTRSSLLPLVVLIYPLVVLVCPFVVLAYSLVVLVCQLVVLVCPFVCLLVVLVCPPVASSCALVVLVWPLVCPLVVLVVLSVGLFINDPYNNNKMIILMNII